MKKLLLIVMLSIGMSKVNAVDPDPNQYQGSLAAIIGLEFLKGTVSGVTAAVSQETTKQIVSRLLYPIDDIHRYDADTAKKDYVLKKIRYYHEMSKEAELLEAEVFKDPKIKMVLRKAKKKYLQQSVDIAIENIFTKEEIEAITKAKEEKTKKKSEEENKKTDQQNSTENAENKNNNREV